MPVFSVIDREFTLFETILALFLIGFLVVVFMQKLDSLTGYTERAYVLSTLTTLRQRANNVLLKAVVDGDYKKIAGLENTNPFALDRALPRHGNGANAIINNGSGAGYYAGLLPENELYGLAGGRWYFDSQAGVLIYLVENNQGIKTDLPGRARIRVRLGLQYSDNDQTDSYTPDDGIYGIRLLIMDKISWFDREIE